MTSKNCTKCGELKLLTCFLKSNGKVTNTCKSCGVISTRNYNRTKQGLLHRIYHHQIEKSKRRRDIPPNYSLDDFKRWALSKAEFHRLHENWVSSNYETKLSPSADRTNDYLGYSLDRLQWITWTENNLKGNEDVKKGLNNKQARAVIQMTKNGDFVAKHHSIRQAERETGIFNTSIVSCCKGKIKYAGRYKWEYAINP